MLTLPNLKHSKTVFLAVGNVMRGDDAFGPMVYERLAASASANFLPLDGGQMPENYTPRIKAFYPDYLIIADAIAGGARGGLQLFSGDDIDGASLSTHSLPLSVMLKFLKQDLPGLKVFLLAAPAAQTDFGQEPSPNIKTAAQQAAAAIKERL